MRLLYLIVFLSLSILSCNNNYNELTVEREADLFFRQSDNVLNRKDLQEIVKYQNLRDSEGIKKYFTHSDPVIRARAAFAMASVQDSSVLNDLLMLLDDPDENVRMDAAFAIRQNYGKLKPDILVHYLDRESKVEVKAMLLTAIGFNGNISDYDKVMSMALPSELEAYQALCAIYFLEHNNIVMESGIDKMIAILSIGNTEARENAAYLFYAIHKRSITIDGLSDKIRDEVIRYSFKDPAAPYLLAYLSSSPEPADTSLYIGWARNGETLRARSFAIDNMKYYDEFGEIRSELINYLKEDNYQLALAAAYGLSNCEHLSGRDLNRLKSYIENDHLSFNITPYALKALWRFDEKEYVEKYLEGIPESDQLGRASSISGIMEIEIDKFEMYINKLLLSKDRQVALTTVEYLCSRLGSDRNQTIVDLLSEFLSEGKHPRIKSDVILSMAHNMKSTFPEDYRKDLFLNYLTVFEQNEDDQSLAMCLLALGDLQIDELYSLFKTFGNSKSEIIRLAAEGALDIIALDPTDLIDVYKNEMLYSPTLDIDWDLLVQYGRFPQFIFNTTKGEIIIEADIEQAPMSIQNLIDHIDSGVMDSIFIYRVELNHVTQFGTPGHSRYRVLNEITRIPKSEASSGIGHLGKDTGSQHIAITHLIRPHNEGKYTTFGRVVKGQEIVRNADKYDMIIKSSVHPDIRTNKLSK